MPADSSPHRDSARSPVTRWQRAEELLRDDLPLAWWDDDLVGTALNYLRVNTEALMPGMQRVFRSRFAGLTGAHAIHRSNGPVREVIESGLKAGLTAHHIARKVDVPFEVVEAFDIFFFDPVYSLPPASQRG